jgi:hypothetical protein
VLPAAPQPAVRFQKGKPHEFERENDGVNYHDRIDAPSHAWNAELEENTAGHSPKRLLQNHELTKPGVALSREKREIGVCDQAADDLIRVCRN